MFNLSDKFLYSRPEPFEGTFAAFLKELVEYPCLVESAKSRLYRLIMRRGEEKARTERIRSLYGRESLTAYNAFSMFHGIEHHIDTVVTNYLGAAVMGSEADKQALVVIGPPGSGKSDFFTEVKKLYRTAEPFPYLVHSPVKDNPLNLLFLIPRVARERARGNIEKTRQEALRILTELELDQVCDFQLPDAKAVFDKNNLEPVVASLVDMQPDDMVSAIVYGLGLPRCTRNNIGRPAPHVQAAVMGKYQWARGGAIEIAQYPVASSYFDLDDEGAGGIVDVPEVQPLNFSLETWIGGENLANSGRYEDSDPRLVSFTGAFNKGNRGLVILTEGLKNPPEAQRILLEALQGRRVGIPSPLGGSLHFDGLIVIHSNEGEYERFIKERVNEPYVDRFWRIYFGYPLEVSEEAKVVRKFWQSSDFAKPEKAGGVAVEPLLFEYIAHLTLLSRLEPDKSVPLMHKLAAYDGKDVRPSGSGIKVSAAELRQRSTPKEGLTGLSPRDMAKIISALAAEVGPGKGVNTRMFRDRAYEWFRQNVEDDDKRKKLFSFLASELDTFRRKRLKDIVLAAMVPSFHQQCQETFDKYIDNIRAALKGQSVRRTGGWGGQVGGDQEFMRAIESNPEFGVNSAEAPKFRAEVIEAYASWQMDNNGTKVPWTCHGGLSNCVKGYVLKSVQQAARLFSANSARSDEDKKKLSDVKQRIMENDGYNEWLADELLREAEETKDFLIEK